MGNELMTDLSMPSPDSNAQVSPETLVPRLGDYLIETGVLSPDNLQTALNHQRKKEIEGKPCLLGQALLELGLINRDTLDQAIIKQLASLQTTLRETNRQLEQRVQQRTKDLEQRLVQIRTAAEITRVAISAPDLDDLLRRTVNLISERFGFRQITVFLVDPTGEQLVLNECNTLEGKTLKRKGYRLGIDETSLVGWVTIHNTSKVISHPSESTFTAKDHLLANVQSEAGIPITIGNTTETTQKVLGVLHVQHSEPDAFDPDVVAMLQTLSNHTAVTIENIRLLEVAQQNFKEISSLYQTSHQVAQADSPETIFQAVSDSLSRMPFFSTILRAEHRWMRLLSVHYPDSETSQGEEVTFPEQVSISPAELAPHLVLHPPQVINLEQDSEFPDALLFIPRLAGCKAAAFIPIFVKEKLEAIFLLGSRRVASLTPAVLTPYISMAELVTTALEKTHSMQSVEKRLTTLETLNTLSKSVSIGTEMKTLYQAIHQEVIHIIGDVVFAIALFDSQQGQLHIPYLCESEGGEIQTIEPYPYGEGLTSIVVRDRQPLMIVENMQDQAKTLGAKQIDKPAKSWLGVPLLVGGEVIGVLFVQDLEREYRFDEDDQRLLNTLASQVAAAIYNARLLGTTYQQAEHERLRLEITNKIRGSIEIQTILKTTASELAKVLGARRARIEIGEPGSRPSS
jgi:GAF domain-containing protein